MLAANLTTGNHEDHPLRPRWREQRRVLRSGGLKSAFETAACALACLAVVATAANVRAQSAAPTEESPAEASSEGSQATPQGASGAEDAGVSELNTEAPSTTAVAEEGEGAEGAQGDHRPEYPSAGETEASAATDAELPAAPAAAPANEALAVQSEGAAPPVTTDSAERVEAEEPAGSGDFQRPWPERKRGTPRQGLTWDVAFEAGGALRLYGPLPAYYFTSLRAGGLWLKGDFGLSFGATVGSGAALDRWGTGVELQLTHLTSSLWGQAGLSFADGNSLVSRVTLGFSLIGLEYQHRFDGSGAVDVLVFKVNLPIGIFVAHL